ncbi:hypothetical protein JCM10908_001382 [Rhodotorula pacifica]|uniref:Bsc6p n=1 Tax=Rhodotorula pacifica TaxID=1495444 RepID=UPI0031794C58
MDSSTSGIAHPAPVKHAHTHGQDHALSSLPSPPLTPPPHGIRTNSQLARSDLLERTASQRSTTTTMREEALIAHAAKSAKWDTRLREISCHISLVIAGWGDASSGPLIPYMQAHYKISYTVVSMLFVGQAAGFFIAALVNSWLTQRFGLGKVIVIGAALQALAYGLLTPAFPFPAFPVIFAFGGFGMALQDAQANVYIAGQPNAEVKLGYLHASYGLGAAVVPLAATGFASSGILFARFYAISCGLALLNTALLLYGFKFSYVVDVSEPISETIEAPGVPPLTVLEGEHAGGESIEMDQRQTEPTTPTEKWDRSELEAGRIDAETLDTRFGQASSRPVKKSNIMVDALKTRATVFASLFILLYVGSEVSMGGWIVTFLLDNRNGGPDAGYVATGFWFGLMVGRIILNPLTIRIGEKRALYCYLTIALALEFAIWFADSLVGNAVVVALIGVLIGPCYPVAISVLTKVIPRRLHATSIGFCASFGQIGAAAFPFAVGALAQRFSPAALQPVMVVLFAVQMAFWWLVPRPPQKKE